VTLTVIARDIRLWADTSGIPISEGSRQGPICLATPCWSLPIQGHVMNTVVSRKPRRFVGLVSLLMLTGLLCAGQYIGTSAAGASSSLAAVPAARVVPAQALISQICTPQGAHALCMNRNGGGHSPGTYVIAWSANDPNDDFAFFYLTGMCNAGKVSADLECPFTPNKGLNAKYNGHSIVEIYNWDTGLCVADSGTGSGATVLDKCPDGNGNGGADGTIFTLSNATQTSGKPPTTYVVNRYWSDFSGEGGGNGTTPKWLCTIGKGLFLIENNPQGLAGPCQWQEI